MPVRARRTLARADSLADAEAKREAALQRNVFDAIDARVARGTKRTAGSREASREKPPRPRNDGAPPVPPRKRRPSRPSAFNPNCLPML